MSGEMVKVKGCENCPMAKVDPTHKLPFCGYNNHIAAEFNEPFTTPLMIKQQKSGHLITPDWCPLKEHPVAIFFDPWITKQPRKKP